MSSSRESWNECQFGVTIADAFGFRSLFEFLLQTGFKTVRLFFTNREFYIRDRDDTKKIIVDVDVEMIKVNYYYESDRKQQYVDIDVSKIQKELKSAAVKTAIIVKKEKSNPLLCFKLYNNGNISGDATTTILVEPIERTTTYGKWKIQEPNLDQCEIGSNFYTTTTDFARTCSGFSKKGGTKKNPTPTFLQIDAYEEGVKITATESNDSSSAKRTELGFFDPSEYLFTYYLPQSVIQSFQMINKFNKQNGIVHFFFEKDKPIKITVPCSGFGVIRFYCHDYHEEE